MRIRRKPWARPELAACPYYIPLPPQHCGSWRAQFGNPDAPLILEIGCGKGNFAAQFALLHPECNLLAMDIKSEMLAVARRTVSAAFEEQGREVNNLFLMAQDAERIDLMLDSADAVDCIYINFCNPWPRMKHKKRRLTHPRQLMKYRGFLKDGGEIHFKTDNDPLFLESLEYFTQCGFVITDITFDLANANVSEHIVTEHETMFTAEGIPIKQLIARKEPFPQKNA